MSRTDAHRPWWVKTEDKSMPKIKADKCPCWMCHGSNGSYRAKFKLRKEKLKDKDTE